MKKLLASTMLICLSKTTYAEENIQEKHCKALAIFKEANSEPLKGKRAVLDVIETRMNKYNKSACEVIKQKGQFSWVNKKNRNNMKASEEMLEQYENISVMPKVFDEAEFFHNIHVKPNWKRLRRIERIGNHIFYKRM